MTSTPVPADLRTDRLYLRSWRTTDAALLLPALEANVDHLSNWIPAHVATPAPLPDLELRLAKFAEDFLAGRYWRYAIFPRDESDLLGEVSLFPRSAEGRVEFAAADRLEIGYWLRSDVTGKGYATESARAMLQLSLALPGIRQVEIHCDPRNVSSAAVPQRLGFRLASADAEPASIPSHEPATMLWVFDVRAAHS
ncbi:MAG: GNAT family N-acetyltransferase [Woeseiaceae bacterium]